MPVSSRELGHQGKLSSEGREREGLIPTVGQPVREWQFNMPLEREPRTQEKSLEEQLGICWKECSSSLCQHSVKKAPLEINSYIKTPLKYPPHPLF